LGRNYEELIDEAYEALEQARFDDALDYGRQAIETEPAGAPGHYLAGAALVEMRHFEEAVPCLRTALDIDPDYPDARFCLASARFSTCHFTAARYELQRVMATEPEMADAHYWTGMCLEREGDYEGADESFRRAVELDPTRFHLPFRVPRDEFDRVVKDAIARLPEYFRSYLDNLHLVVDDLPAEDLLFEFDPPLDPELFGLFLGTPLMERSLMDTVPATPDRIYIFRRNLERYCTGRDRLVAEIRITLLHEVGHAMGLDDDGLQELGYE
jgi:predicted Zn-dependent protease with MMP-like domain